ncbi:MAG: acyl-CoA dehydratase activase [Planctomycetes bacterium]|jgi:predicted CoA-substrate-specific enzyme activase|nr:acyl-CoA dehydratase activase [Planctomycetota bacterium]
MDAEALFLGVDVGSTAVKAVAVGGGGAARGRAVLPSGTDLASAARAAADRALAEAGRPDAARCVATGYGRRNVAFAQEAVTEITCHARGAAAGVRPPFTLVDIGGQDNKIIRVGRDGRVEDFSMNRKCAAGTGTFLEEISRRLGLSPGELEAAARRASGEAEIGSFCTVFASTEVLHRIRQGEPVEAIARGALRSVVRRVAELGEFRGTVALSGGVVAFHPLVAELLAEETGSRVEVVPDPQCAGALGAALIARDGAR